MYRDSAAFLSDSKNSIASFGGRKGELCFRSVFELYVFSADAYITDLKQVTETVSEQIGEAMKVRSVCSKGIFVSFLVLIML